MRRTLRSHAPFPRISRESSQRAEAARVAARFPCRIAAGIRRLAKRRWVVVRNRWASAKKYGLLSRRRSAGAELNEVHAGCGGNAVHVRPIPRGTVAARRPGRVQQFAHDAAAEI